MRRLGTTGCGFVLALFAAGAADATVIVSGGGPSADVNGALRALAVDPIAADVDESYSDSKNAPFGNGSLPGGGSDFATGGAGVYDGESTVASSAGSASYAFQFGQLNGDLNAGSISLNAYMGIGIAPEYFEDSDESDDVVPQALAYGRATAIQFIDLEIVGIDYVLDMMGSVQDDNAGIDNILSYFVSLADTTNGFAFLGLYQDTTTQDFQSTPFSDSFTLLAGHTYRIGIGAATDYLCTSVGPVSCPTENNNGDPVESDPQPPGFYGQSGSATLDFTLTPVPEPGTGLLVAAGLVALAARRRG